MLVVGELALAVRDSVSGFTDVTALRKQYFKVIGYVLVLRVHLETALDAQSVAACPVFLADHTIHISSTHLSPRTVPFFARVANGAEPCKQLWKYLYDKLTNTYKLNNLVWVWTVQTSDAGKLAAVEKRGEGYPVGDCGDIVGSDLYVEKNTTQSAVFKRVNDSVKGKKMVALCEIGILFNMDACYEEGAPWLYFLTWNDAENGSPVFYSKNSDGSYNWNNTVADWKSALSNTYVLNRGDVTNWK